MLKNQLSKGNNGLVKTKYITFGPGVRVLIDGDGPGPRFVVTGDPSVMFLVAYCVGEDVELSLIHIWTLKSMVRLLLPPIGIGRRKTHELLSPIS